MSIVTVNDIRETINMIQNENLDVRTITMGISLYDCVSDDIDRERCVIGSDVGNSCATSSEGRGNLKSAVGNFIFIHINSLFPVLPPLAAERFN